MNKSNTISILKIMSSICVIFFHTIAITNVNGIISQINLFLETNFVSLGKLAVSMLFLISGYLYASSLEKKEDDRLFWKRKIIRLLIPLFIVVVFTIITGTFISNLSVKEYFLSIDTYKYLLNIFFIPFYKLPGVFTNNPYPNVVNGSLWTMPITILCYLSCFVVWKTNKNTKQACKYIVIVLFVLFFVAVFTEKKFLIDLTLPFTSFYFGIFYRQSLDKIKFNKKILTICIVLQLLFSSMGYSIFSYFITFPYIVFYLVNKTNINKNIYKYDCSYEMYLCAFPIQQSLVYVSKNGLNQITHFLIATLLSTAFAIMIKCISKKITERLKIYENICHRS